MIVSPWGEILAEVAEGEGVAVAEIDFERQEKIRRELPALSHIRLPLSPPNAPK
jgi:nitrilase